MTRCLHLVVALASQHICKAAANESMQKCPDPDWAKNVPC